MSRKTKGLFPRIEYRSKLGQVASIFLPWTKLGRANSQPFKDLRPSRFSDNHCIHGHPNRSCCGSFADEGPTEHKAKVGSLSANVLHECFAGLELIATAKAEGKQLQTCVIECLCFAKEWGSR